MTTTNHAELFLAVYGFIGATAALVNLAIQICRHLIT